MAKINEVAVDQIELLPKHLDIVCKIADAEVIPDDDFWNDQYQYLARLGLIERFFFHKYPSRPTVDLELPRNAIHLTDKGLLFVARHKKEVRDKKKEDRRYWITTGIALIALAASILSVASEVGIISLPQISELLQRLG